MRALTVMALLSLAALLLPSCGRAVGENAFGTSESTTPISPPASSGASPTDVVIPPAPPPAEEMATLITNPWLPITPGTTLTYEGMTGDGFVHIESYVTHDIRRILGVDCTVVVVNEYVNGELKEQTVDWFAQDSAGNVWYMGEDVRDFEDGVMVSTKGSWKAGVDGAAPGIAMPAEPIPGEFIASEYLPGVAQDQTEIIALEVPVKLADGTEHICLQTKEWSPLDPDEVEYKYYAPGTGLVKEGNVDGSDEIELTGEDSDDD